MTKRELRDRAQKLGMTMQELLRSPAITRWYGVKDKPADDGQSSK